MRGKSGITSSMCDVSRPSGVCSLGWCVNRIKEGIIGAICKWTQVSEQRGILTVMLLQCAWAGPVEGAEEGHHPSVQLWTWACGVNRAKRISVPPS